LLLVVEVRLENLVEGVQRLGQRLAGLLRWMRPPRLSRDRHRVDGPRHRLVLMRDPGHHRRLVRYALLELGEQQRVLGRVVVVQHVDAEPDVLGEELDALGRGHRVVADQPGAR